MREGADEGWGSAGRRRVGRGKRRRIKGKGGGERRKF